jgi:hypothetical protein
MKTKFSLSIAKTGFILNNPHRYTRDYFCWHDDFNNTRVKFEEVYEYVDDRTKLEMLYYFDIFLAFN